VKFVTIAFASAIALSAIAPAFAYENDLEGATPASSMQAGEHHAMGKRAGHHRANDARAYEPFNAPTSAPVSAPVGGPDFGIGSQS
jgi:hypothetical protein